MSTDRKAKSRKLSHEVLLILAVCFAVAVALCFFLISLGVVIVDGYYETTGTTPTEEELYKLDSLVVTLGLGISVGFFVILFLILLGERLAYISKIIKGVDTLREGDLGYRLELEGNNELTRLAEAINYLSETERELKEKEDRINSEKEELIRTLSHDIRTPLTSIVSYTELLSTKAEPSREEYDEYIALVRKKSEQIKNLTDLLLEGGRREVEHFDDARLLFEQLAFDFEESLEDDFKVRTDLSSCHSFVGDFDVNELRRVFDNLVSNVKKYADTAHPVCLRVEKTASVLTVTQTNAISSVSSAADGYHIGIISIKRIAHNYGGRVETVSDGSHFEIKIALSKF